jgi:(p)ppGpp synthase/HD superfamily hydrolase
MAGRARGTLPLVTASPLYGPRVGEALRFAADAFAHRIRKGSGAPYLTHLLSVTTLVMEHGGDEDQICAAVLHDYLEDIPEGSAAQLEARFGARVTRIVQALSDATDPHDKPPWKPRKLAYLAHLRVAPHDVKLVSAADKLHNARSILADHARIGDEVFARFSAPREETLWYYREVARALAEGFAHPLVDEVRRAVRAMHEATGAPHDLG